MNGLFMEVELAMEMKVLWEKWLAQPPQHRALYITVAGHKRSMESIDAREAADE